MRIKLPENFGGMSQDGEAVTLEPDADGCVDVEDGIAQALLTHGGTVAPDPVEENAKIDALAAEADDRIAALRAKKQKAAR
jgi:hypothetical protein